MEKWIEIAVGKMHVNKISQEKLASKLGLRRDYVNKILNGIETPKNAEERIMSAIDEIIKAKKEVF